jgi:hypothetical protein
MFLLVVECLSRSLNHEAHSPNLLGISITLGHKITHLLFVDDILLFCSGQRRDAEKLAKILKMFHLAIGMIINVQKSTISFYRMEEET